MLTARTSSPKQAVVDFLREEAPLEYERLRSIGRLASTRSDSSGDPPDLSQISYGRWVREALGLLAI